MAKKKQSNKKEPRINTYFCKTVEDKELWNFLEQHHPDDKSTWLKYYARQGIQYILSINKESIVNIPKALIKPNSLAVDPDNPTLKSLSTADVDKPTLTSSSGEKSPYSESPTLNNDLEDDEVDLDNLEINIQEVDPAKKIQESLNRFITEEDDEEVLELIKNLKNNDTA